MKVKIIGLWIALGAAVGGAFNLALALTDGNWLLSVAAGLIAVLGARPAYRWWLSTQTNSHEVVPTEYGVPGRIEAIEVFWRPG